MDNKKFEAIYRKYRLLVLEVAYEMLGDTDLAQDICQDVFVKISSQRLDSITTDYKMKKYLILTTRSRVYDLYRKVNFQREVPMDKKQSDYVEPDTMSQNICIEEFANKVLTELKNKSEEWLEIIVRIDIYDEKQEIVARDMNLSYGLLRTKYHRARNWIKKNFAAEYEEIKWF